MDAWDPVGCRVKLWFWCMLWVRDLSISSVHCSVSCWGEAAAVAESGVAWSTVMLVIIFL